jgi:hypothetical protein
VKLRKKWMDNYFRLVSSIVEFHLNKSKSNLFKPCDYDIISEFCGKLFERSLKGYKNDGSTIMALLPLHDHLVFLSKSSRLQDLILQICGSLWKTDLRLRNLFVSQTMTQLLVLAYENGRTNSIRECYKMKDAMLLFNFNDISTKAIKKIIRKASLSSSFLKNHCGRQFLSFIYSNIPHFAFGLTKIVKNQLSSEHKSSVKALGHMIYYAWKWSKTDCRQLIVCALQFFAHASVCAASPGLHIRLILLLEPFNRRNNRKQINFMLSKIYDPLILNSLVAKNAVVRKNAISLLGEIYSNQNCMIKLTNRKAIYYDEFNIVINLILDTCPLIRSKAAETISRFCSNFSPGLMTVALCRAFNILAYKLANDGGSNTSRISAIEAIGSILKIPEILAISKIQIKCLLPLLSDSIEMNVRNVFASTIYNLLTAKNNQRSNLLEFEQYLEGLTNDKDSVAIIFHRILTLMIFKNKDADINKGLFDFVRKYPMAGLAYCRLSSRPSTNVIMVAQIYLCN